MTPPADKESAPTTTPQTPSSKPTNNASENSQAPSREPEPVALWIGGVLVCRKGEDVSREEIGRRAALGWANAFANAFEKVGPPPPSFKLPAGSGSQRYVRRPRKK